MPSQHWEYMNFEKKNKALLHIIWYCIALMMFVEILDYVLYPYMDYPFIIEDYFRRYIVRPFIIHIAIGIISVVLYKLFNNKRPLLTSYLMISAFTLLIHEIVLIHYGVSVIYMAYALPIILSILYNNRRLTAIVAAACTVLYTPIFFFYLPAQTEGTYKHDYMDFTATLIYLAGSLIISLYLMNTYNELIDKIFAVTKDKKSLEKEIQLDSFTKLNNRATFDNALKEYFERNEKEKITFSLFVMDIDNFKKVNDTYGHSFGDVVLLKLVEAIRENIGETALAFRYGGEEFAVIMTADKNEAFTYAENIRTAFNNITIEGHENERFSISIGLCDSTMCSYSPESIFEAADTALYKAKHSGKNMTVMCEKSVTAD